MLKCLQKPALVSYLLEFILKFEFEPELKLNKTQSLAKMDQNITCYENQETLLQSNFTFLSEVNQKFHFQEFMTFGNFFEYNGSKYDLICLLEDI